MDSINQLRSETEALRTFLRQLAGVLSTHEGQATMETFGLLEPLRHAHELADGVVLANEAFLGTPDASAEGAGELLEVTLKVRSSLESSASVVDALHDLQE